MAKQTEYETINKAGDVSHRFQSFQSTKLVILEGGFIYTASADAANRQILLTKYDMLGNVIWGITHINALTANQVAQV